MSGVGIIGIWAAVWGVGVWLVAWGLGGRYEWASGRPSAFLLLFLWVQWRGSGVYDVSRIR